ncbi:non-heme iron oxygenase ferredoxin subunit [Maribrevibacterium harenarium]|uniref:Non-heme iron oxygenase ferredoxin subunit n=1 Tax=Maribrevibacterium harenarium TaxID=2589817 RepID=A0A501WII4_9GAMM|nr:non-heme iron oxygenase ferredoxin subunit [Maribrevibacterium harenarium]TPE48572.1 non-heme iron oxygenase ferredoxin subunit [Maribrevibacterium harenarium]
MTNWIKLIAVDDVPEDDVIGVMAEGHNIAVYKYEGEVYATANLCTHGQALLSDGFLEDGEIECPLHQGRFCIKTGKAMCDPLTRDVATYPLQIDDEGTILVALPV